MKIAMVLSIVSCYFNDYNWQVEDITCKIIWEIVELDKISNWVDNGFKYCFDKWKTLPVELFERSQN